MNCAADIAASYPRTGGSWAARALERCRCRATRAAVLLRTSGGSLVLVDCWIVRRSLLLVRVLAGWSALPAQCGFKWGHVEGGRFFGGRRR